MSTSRPRTRKGGYHHPDLAPALLTAARRLLEAGGPEALSLREVARRAGVSHNAPYRHFPDREALLAALAAEGFADLTAAMQAAAGKAPSERRLGAIGAAYVRFALQAPGRFRLMFGGAARVEDHPVLAAAADRAYAVLDREAGGESGATGSIAAWATVHGLAHLLLDGQIASVRGNPAAAERLIERIFGGPST